MKQFKLIAGIIVAVAAVAGIVFVIATYGNQIVAWCKKIIDSVSSRKSFCSCECVEAEEAEEVDAAASENDFEN